MTDKIEIEFTESKMADNHKNILSLYDIKYDYGESIHLFLTRFREIVAQNLKKTGYKDGSYELSQDEIISPTFEEIIFLWSLEKISPLVCQKVKQKFTDNQTINDLLREEIINFLSEKENFDEIQQRPSKDLCNKCKNVIIAKDDPEIKTNHNDDCSIYIKDEELETLVEVSAELTSIKGVKDEYFQTNGTIMKNGDFKKDDDIFDPDYDPNLDFDDLENLVDNENALKAKSTKKDIIDCNLCGQKCRGQQRLNTHIQRKHNQIFSCRICGEKCHGLQNFKIHRKEAHPDKPKYLKPAAVVCDLCGRSCAGQRRLQEHIKRRHNRTFPCKACDQVFNTKDELKTHRRESHKPTRKPEICPHCGKIIHSKLKRHILTHVSNICCKLCSEKFMTQEELDVHMKKHDENPNYCKRKQRTIQCETCKRTFADAEEYGLHMCKHFSCDTCGQKFMVKRNLETHKRFHNGETVFQCDLCESLFLNRKALYCHKRSAHDPDKKKYKCEECGKGFLNPCHLERHKISHSSVRSQKCNTCGKTFKHKAALDSHIRSHTEEPRFPCVACHMTFKTLMDMKKHREMNKCVHHVKMES